MRTCTRMPPPNMIGIISSPIRKALVLTAAWYSRKATTIVLRMHGLSHQLRGIRDRPGDPHEDVVQRRPHYFKVSHPASFHQIRKKRLSIGARRHPEFLDL